MSPSSPPRRPSRARFLSAPALLTLIAVATLAFAPIAVAPAVAQDAPRSPTPKPLKLNARVTDVARGLEHPWGLEFLPDGRMIVTERPGRLRLIARDGKLSEPLAGVPEVYARGQGGLLDVELSPGFAQDRLVYLSFSEPGDGGAGTAVARGHRSAVPQVSAPARPRVRRV
jgi:glucose/arabinose dehydrogenase